MAAPLPETRTEWAGDVRLGDAVTIEPPSNNETVRSAEIVASLSLATDLGMGFPFEHGLHATLMAMHLAELAEVDNATATRIYYSCLLVYVGCTTDAYEGTTIFGGRQTENVIPVLFGSRRELVGGVLQALPRPEATGPRRIYDTIRRIPGAIAGDISHQRSICEVAEIVSERIGLPGDIAGLFPLLTERFDGKGRLGRASGHEIPLALRIAELSRDIAYQATIGDTDHVVRTERSRAGGAFDPDLVDLFVRHADEVIGAGRPSGSAWDEVLSSEPVPHLYIEGGQIDKALEAIGDFTDLLCPSLTNHSSGVADLAERGARLAGFDDADVVAIRRGALIHDVGRVAVDASIWEKPAALTTDEIEQVRLHPYHTGRVFTRSPFLSELAGLAICHHERLDGSGYHRGLTAQTLDPRSRLIAVADTFHALTEPRAYRAGMAPSVAVDVVVELASSGVLDSAMVRAVVEAAGEPVPDVENPAGLTDREIEVLGLLARGLQTKQIARSLEVSPKTADTHIQAAYRKIGVSTRAAATLYVMEHGLTPSGEFPMVSRTDSP